MDYNKDIESFMYEVGKLTTVEQGRRFLHWSLQKLFDRTETDLENSSIKEGVLFTDGANDYGVDCSFFDGDTLYIIQGKYRNTHSYDNVYHFIMQIGDFLNLNNARELRTSLAEVYSLLNDDSVNEVKIYYITNNYLSEEFLNRGYQKKCEEFNEKYSNILQKNVSIRIVGFEDFASIHTGIMLELPKEVKNSAHRLYLEKAFENKDKTSIVAEVSLKVLARLVVEHKNYIFHSNIRNYKGLNNINKGIKETYEKTPKKFWYYNNGITIVCKDYNFNANNNVVNIIAPQIVNGCQTATTIANCWNSSNPQEKESVDGTILVKIIRDSKNEKRKDITKYTNSQTAVTGKDFFALESFHTELKNNFRDIGYFYEIQSNSARANNLKYKGNDKYRHLFDNKFNNDKNSFTAKEITQTYVATILDMPAKAKNIGQFMPGCEKYDKVFHSKTPSDPRFYILPYGVWYYLKKVYQLPDNKIIDKDKWSTSLLYTTKVFFKILDKAYNENHYEYTTDEFIALCENKITSRDTFEKLAKTTFKVMKDFYSDSSIKEIIGDNLPKFLKSAIETNHKVEMILNDKIENNIDELQ